MATPSNSSPHDQVAAANSEIQGTTRLPSPPLLISEQKRKLTSISKTCSPLSLDSTSDDEEFHTRIRKESGDEYDSDVSLGSTGAQGAVPRDDARHDPDYKDDGADDGVHQEGDVAGHAEDPELDAAVMPSDLLNRLKTFSLFKNAPPAFHRAIARRLKLMQYHPQEYIVKAGEPAMSMYWILRGTVGVTSTDGEALYAELVAGSFFGEIGILFNRARTATVVARTRVLLGVLTKDVLNQVLPDFPIIERLIRDEAQERLAMQEKKKRANLICLPSRRNSYSSITPPLQNGIAASAAAEANSAVPGPVLPPAMPQDQDRVAQMQMAEVPGFSNATAYVDDVDESIGARDFLKNLPLFQTLPSQLIHELALSAILQKLKVFEYVCRKGDSGTDIFFIVAGQVEIIDPSKSNAILARLGPGKYFGEMAFLSALSNGNDGDKRSADIRTTEETVLMIVTGAKLQNICERYPAICEEMKQTAGERCKHNGSIDGNSAKNDGDGTDGADGADGAPALVQPVVRRMSSFRIIHADQDDSPERPSGSDAIVWKPGFAAQDKNNDSDSGSKRSPSPLSDVFSSRANSTAISSASSATIPSWRWKQSVKREASPRSDPTAVLSVPPLNAQMPQLNSLSFKHPGPMQYMPLAKRLRLNQNNSFSRRRSSLLSTGPLNDRIMLKVFSYLDLPSLMKLRRVCRRWRQLLLVTDELFHKLDLRPWNTTITDEVLKKIIDFVGSRPHDIDISDCFHITDEGFSYLVNEIGIKGSIQKLKMRSVWKVSAMAIMDLSVPSVGHHLEEIQLVNCRNVRDDVLERLIGRSNFEDALYPSLQYQYGCANLKHLDLSYCKHLTDKTMAVLAEIASSRLETLILTRCTTITDHGFRAWSMKQFPHLQKLVLKDCTYLTDNSIISVATAAPNLTYLDTSFCCALSDSSVDFLCFCCKHLKFLNLSFCGSAVSDISLVSISRLNSLHKLIIVGCLRVTREGVDRLLSGSRSLSLIDLGQCKNAHDYPYGGGPAEKWVPRPGSRSAFIKVEPFDRIVEIIL